MVEDRNKRALESYRKWYKIQSWYAKLFIMLFRLRECYEGAYCDGWMDCEEHIGYSANGMKDEGFSPVADFDYKKVRGIGAFHSGHRFDSDPRYFFFAFLTF